MADSKHTKRALLGSALALILCFAMLLGTTFAWFTDTAKTNVNNIQAGTLKVDIQREDGYSLDGKTLEFHGKGGINDAKFWEPGATYELTPFKIVNKGNLALKFKIDINGFAGTGNEDIDKASLLGAIDFDVKFKQLVYKDVSGGNGFYGWVNEETTIPLSALSEGENIILAAGTTFGTQLDWRGETPLFTIVAHMREDAGNEYQGLSLEGLGITVLATQATVEEDIKDNSYDMDAEYPEYSDPSNP